MSSVLKNNPSALNCKPYFRQFIDCVKETDCVRVQGKSLRHCSCEPTLDDDCHKLWLRWFECKKGVMDPRNRMRGNRKL